MKFSAPTTLLASALLLPLSSAYWRMSCFQGSGLVQERVDPIIAPGAVSGHTHTVVGGSAFAPSTNFKHQRTAKCTTCPPKMDLSNYWSPMLYFHYANGSVVSVKNFDFVVYYEQRYSSNTNKLYAFPEEFRMLAGNPTLRSFKPTLAQRAISFVCLNYAGGAPPQQNSIFENAATACPDGMRAQVNFPSCWNGKPDSADHQSHVAYPDGVDHGDCPKSHPKRLISIFFEVDFAVGDYASIGHLAANPSQPFVFAYGDPHGYGFHGDFVNGWPVETLQKAIDTCTADSGSPADCAVFGELNSGDATCRKTPIVDEVVVDKILPKLPGCNPITSGPGASPMHSCKHNPPMFKKAVAYVNSTIPPPGAHVPGNVPTIALNEAGWKYSGCYTDAMNGAGRTLANQLTVDGGMTVPKCLAECKAKGYKYCGLEYAEQCFGDNTMASTGTKTNYGDCSDPCQGNPLQYCGAGNRLTVYTKQ